MVVAIILGSVYGVVTTFNIVMPIIKKKSAKSLKLTNSTKNNFMFVNKD